MTKTESSLTVGERKKLAELETTIESGLQSFIEVGNALAAIRDRKLYTDVHETFEGYCKSRWGFAKSHAYRLIDSAKVVKNLSPMGDIPPPTNERVARELAEIEDENKQADVWSKAVETAPKDKSGQPKITAAHVAKVRDEVLGPQEPEPTKPEPVAEKETEGPLTDDEGQVVPKSLAEIFGRAAEFEQHARTLAMVQKWANDIASDECAMWFHVQSFVADLNNAKQALRFNKPYAVCPYCQAKKRNCEACKGKGFVSKGIYKAAPSELRV